MIPSIHENRLARDILAVAVVFIVMLGGILYLLFRPYQQEVSSIAVGVPNCTAQMISASASWQGATGALAGVAKLTNISHRPCSLPAVLPVAVMAGAQMLSVVQASAANATSSLVLPSNGTISARVIWRNWCGGPLPGSVTLMITLPDTTVVPAALRDSSDSPRCDASGSFSTLEVGSFSSGGGAAASS